MAGLGTTVNILGWLFWSMATIAVILRLVSTRYRNDYLQSDDYTMLLSLFLNLGGVIFGSVSIHYGLGQHVYDLTTTAPDMIPKAGLWAVVSNSFCLFGDVVPKLAVALLVNRILCPSPRVKAFHIGMAVLLIIFSVVTFLVGLLQCHPVAHQWNPKDVPGYCLPSKVFENIGIAEGALGCFVDLYFSLFPPIVIFRLQMALKKKIVTSITMSLGLFTLFTTMYKTASVLPMLSEAQADVTYIFAQVILWGLLESSVTIIAGSIPLWGWILRSRSIGVLVDWISLKSLRSMRSGDGFGSGGRERDGHQKIKSPMSKATENDPDSLASLVELERSAAR